MALLALMLLSAIAIGMMFISSTETTISSNFRSEETAYFAARAGVEEVRDRMLPSPPNPSSGNYSIYNSIAALNMPGTNPWALYILNGKNQSGANMAMSDVTNVSGTNLLADDELCHDFYGYSGMAWAAANVKCSGSTALPSGSAWYGNSFTQSLQPVGGNSNPLDYKWIRITLKANNTYAGSGSNSMYVDSTQAGTYQVCWNGSNAGAHEIVIPPGAHCTDSAYNSMPVFLVTALALTPSGAKRIVQQEVAQTFIPYNVPGGLYATGTGCTSPPTFQIAGNAQTGSFNSSSESTPTNPPTNLANSGGDIGSNGNLSIGGTSTNVNGSVNTNQPNVVGNCPNAGVSVSGNPTYGNPPGTISSTQIYTPPVPPIPNPLPPNGACPANCPTYKNTTLSAGSYGNVTIKGNVTLTGGTAANPAVFTLNSLTLNGGANLTINGYIVLNLAGANLTAAGLTNVLDMTGGSFATSSNVPAAFTINYGGSAPMIVTGGTDAYAVINAPNSGLTFHGGSNFYGSAIANTINDLGGTNFYWDTALHNPPPANTTTFHDVALRELSY